VCGEGGSEDFVTREGEKLVCWNFGIIVTSFLGVVA